MFQGLVDPILLIAGGNVLSNFLDTATTISHSDRHTDTRQHFKVVIGVTKCHDLVEIKAIFFSDSAYTFQFRISLIDDIRCKRIATCQFQVFKISCRLLRFFWRHQHQNLVDRLIHQMKQVLFLLGNNLADHAIKRLTHCPS